MRTLPRRHKITLDHPRRHKKIGGQHILREFDSAAMGNVVSNTADILAILGGATTLIIGIFGAIRLSRCQTVRCCWGCVDLINRPLGDAKMLSLPGGIRTPATPPDGGTAAAPTAFSPGASLGAPLSAPLSAQLTPSNSEGYISPVVI